MKKSTCLIVCFLIVITSCQESKDVFPFRKDGKWGLVSSEGEIVLKPKYRQIDFPSQGKEVELIKVVDTLGKTGYIDFGGNEIITTMFDRGTYFMDEFAFVCNDGSYPSMIDKSGKTTEFEGVMMASRFQEGFAVIQKLRRYGIINKKGQIVITPQYLGFGNFSNGLAAIQCDICNPDDLENSTRGKWGYIDVNGKVVIQPRFDSAFEFDSNGIAIVSEGGNYYYIYKSGEKLFERKFDEIYPYFEGLAKVKKGDFIGFVNRNGQESIPFLYLSATNFFKGLASVQLKDGSWGLIDNTGKFVLQPIFDEISPMFGSSVLFKKGSEKGLMKVDSQEVLFVDFDEYYKNPFSDFIIASCQRNYEKVVEDIFAEENFPFLPILIQSGLERVKEKVERDKNFVPWKSSLMALKQNYLSENAIQDFKGVGYDKDFSSPSRKINVLTTQIKMPAFSGEDVDELMKEVEKKVESFGPISQVRRTNFDPDKFDESLIWDFEDFFLSTSYKWDFFNGNLEDSFLLDVRIDFKQ